MKGVIIIESQRSLTPIYFTIFSCITSIIDDSLKKSQTKAKQKIGLHLGCH